MKQLRLVTWNAEWQRRTGPKGTILRRILLNIAPDIACLSEAHTDILKGDYHGIFSDPDHGYEVLPDRRKVTLWSRTAWRDVDDFGSPDLPKGRYVAGTTSTPVGDVRVLGLCIPWRNAHVSTGRRDRAPWEDHERYLRALQPIVERERSTGPLLVMGDFNQRVPARLVPQHLATLLSQSLGDLRVWTAGSVDGADAALLCHAAGEFPGALVTRTGLSRFQEGRRLTDHNGALVVVSTTER